MWIVHVLGVCVYRDMYVLKKLITFKSKKLNQTVITFSFGLVLEI